MMDGRRGDGGRWRAEDRATVRRGKEGDAARKRAAAGGAADARCTGRATLRWRARRRRAEGCAFCSWVGRTRRGRLARQPFGFGLAVRSVVFFGFARGWRIESRRRCRACERRGRWRVVGCKLQGRSGGQCPGRSGRGAEGDVTALCCAAWRDYGVWGRGGPGPGNWCLSRMPWPEAAGLGACLLRRLRRGLWASESAAGAARDGPGRSGSGTPRANQRCAWAKAVTTPAERRPRARPGPGQALRGPDRPW